MNTQNQTSMTTFERLPQMEAVLCLLDHPDEVIRHPRLSRGEKRALLASWASDAHAVENQPTLRRLDNGAVIPVDQILSALKVLDEMHTGGEGSTGRVLPWRSASRGRAFLDAWRRSGRSSGPDDDDDPPPCPAAIAPRPRAPSGIGVMAGAELACA
jgi:hypothetical protein